MARSPGGRREPSASYDKVVAAARLRNIRLIRSEFLVEAEAVGSDQKGWSHGFGCDLAEARFDGERNMASGLVAAEAWSKLGRRKIISLKCRYVVAYDLEGAADEASAVKFIERVGRFAAYPYFRAHFAEVTSQAGVRLPPLPVLKESKFPVHKADAKPASS